MDTLTLRHTATSGTVLLGTAKGDGAADALRAAGFRWRWSRHIGDYGAWYVPHTRDRAPALGLIDRYADVLRAAGFTVEVDIDATPRRMEEAEADRAERMDARAERLSDRAARRLAQADAHQDAANRIAEHIPFGQPILVGHHSERRARADQERIARNMDASCQLRQESRAAHAAAETTQNHMKYRYNPLQVGRRLERLHAERRSVQRALDGYTRNSRNGRGVIVYSDTFPPASGQHRVQLEAQAAQLDEQVRYWDGVLDHMRAAGLWAPIDAATIRPGDLIKYRQRWLKVARVNKKTVAVETGYSWTDKVPLH
ncbi:MAG: DUF3560 domain-containing protein, partial [Acidobacteria bacterium]|nr:DUF3560 domain-containing protein [Acidobacteriota bacterium]